MAAGKFTIEASFKALDKITAPVRRMQQRMAAFQKATERMSAGLRKLDALTSRITSGIKTAAAVTTAVGAAAGFALYNIGKAGADFEEAITSVGAVGLQTRDQIQDLEKKALELGSTTKFTATEAANAMEIMARAGFKNSEILAGVGGVLSAAAASGLEMAEVANHVSNVLKGMGLEATEAARVADVLALASARTNSSIGSLGESMKNLAPVARQLNIPMEQAVAAVALLQDVGLDASEAGTATATMLTKLAKPIPEIAQKMKQLGISFQDAQGNALPLPEIFAQFDKAAKKSGGNMEVLAFFSDLVGLRGQKAALNLKEMFASGKLTSLTKELDGAAGAAEKMAGLRMQNLKGDLTLLESAVDGVKVAIFSLESGPMRNAVKRTTEWVSANQGLIVSKVQEWIEEGTLIIKSFSAGVKSGVAYVREFTGGIESAIGPLDELFGDSSNARIANAHQLGRVVVIATAGFVGFVVVTKAASAAVILFSVGTKLVTATMWLFNAVLATVRAGMLFYAIASKAGVASTIAMSFASKAVTIDLIAQKVASFAAALGLRGIGAASLGARVGLKGVGAAAAGALGPIGLVLVAVQLLVDAFEELKSVSAGWEGIWAGVKGVFTKGSYFEGLEEHENKQARAAAAVREQAAPGMDRIGAGVTDFGSLTSSMEGLEKELAKINAVSLGSDLEVQRDPAAANKQVPQVLSPSERAATRVERSVTEMKDKLEITIKDETGKAEVTEKPKRAEVRRPQIGSSGSF